MEDELNSIGKFLDPVAIVAQLQITKDSVVADFGCGPGYFTFPFAKAVGEGGMVYSFDILPQIIETVAGKAKFSGVMNVIPKRANLENENGTKLKDESVDWVILKDILFQNQKKQAILAEAYRILKTGGRVLVIEWAAGDLTIGPSLNIRIPEADLREMFLGKNFSIEKEIEVGNFHYSFVAKK